MKKITSFLILLSLSLAACGTTPSTEVSQPVEDTPAPTPYPDTPSPPKIDAPVVKSPSLTTIQFVNSLDGWGVTENEIVRTNDGGNTWYNVTPADVSETGFSVDLFVLDNDHVLMQVPDFSNYPNSGLQFHTTDGGMTWSSVSVPFSRGHIKFLDQNNGWVLADLGVGAGSNAVAVYQTTDGGVTWSQKYINDPNNANASESLPLGGLKAGIAPLNMQTAWVYGVIYSSGTVYLFRTDDGGVNWSEVSLPLPQGAENFELGIDAEQMRFVSPTDGFVIVRMTGNVTQLAVYVSNDAGNTWALTPTLIPVGGPVDFLSADEAVIYNRSQFYVTRDTARTWSIIPPDVNFGDTLVVMDFVDVNTGWVITEDPTTSQRSLYRTGDGGATWFPVVP